MDLPSIVFPIWMSEASKKMHMNSNVFSQEGSGLGLLRESFRLRSLELPPSLLSWTHLTLHPPISSVPLQRHDRKSLLFHFEIAQLCAGDVCQAKPKKKPLLIMLSLTYRASLFVGCWRTKCFLAVRGAGLEPWEQLLQGKSNPKD